MVRVCQNTIFENKRSLRNIKYSFSLKGLFLPEFTWEKTVLLHRTRQKLSWPYKPGLKICKPLLHDTKSYFLYTLFFRKFTSEKMILQLPIQLSMWCTSLCELINNNQKQSNLSLTMLESISLSGNDIFSQSCDLNSTFDTNAWAILETLIDNLRSNSPLSRKTQTKLSENVISVLVPFGKDRCLKYKAFQISLKNGVQTFEQQRNQKFRCYLGGSPQQ